MNSKELADEIMSAVLAVQDRILTVGKDQYSEGDRQRFELMSLKELVQYAREEVEDGIAYNVMLRWKLNRLEQAIDESYAGYATNAARQPQVVTHLQPTPLGDSIMANYPNAADLFGGVR